MKIENISTYKLVCSLEFAKDFNICPCMHLRFDYLHSCNVWKFSIFILFSVFRPNCALMLINLSSCLLFYLSTCLLVYLSTCLPVYLSTCLLVYLSTCLLVYLSTCLTRLKSILSKVWLKLTYRFLCCADIQILSSKHNLSINQSIDD